MTCNKSKSIRLYSVFVKRISGGNTSRVVEYLEALVVCPNPNELTDVVTLQTTHNTNIKGYEFGVDDAEGDEPWYIRGEQVDINSDHDRQVIYFCSGNIVVRKLNPITKKWEISLQS